MDIKDLELANKNPNEFPLSGLKNYPVTVLIVDDQAIIIEAIRRMLADEHDIVIHSCTDPTMAIQIANKCLPTVILQDLVMPEIDGLTLVKYFRANSATRDIPMIVLSSKEDPLIKAQAFALGANDYMVKLPDKLELLARIRYHSNSYIGLLQRNEAYAQLVESQKTLRTELGEAAAYVKSLLPMPLDGAIKTSWIYIPSTQLGGDAFGYHWIDPDHLAMYLLDVCGHGIGAALLSISVMNVLRSQALSNTNFAKPSHVLEALNDSFPMEKHNDMFFTIWYGVYDKPRRQIIYSSGGHPPAILMTGSNPDDLKAISLKTSGLVIGGMPGVDFKSATIQLEKYNKLFIFSDGVYEITKPDGSVMALEEFVDVIKQPSQAGISDLDRILKFAQTVNGRGPFADDFSIVQVVFKE